MRRSRTIQSIIGAFVVLSITSAIAMAQTDSRTTASRLLGDETRSVDVVIAIDTSGSMENLLDSVRARIWDVVHELELLEPVPLLRVGLLSFGTDQATEEEGFIIVHLDLTDQLDDVYAELMDLRIGGGTELVGRVLDRALDEMSWSPEWNALRVIFIAGNESADQEVENADFRIAARAAQDQDIIINALYAGNREQGVVENWHEVARTGLGNFSVIDVATGSIQIASPQDDLLLELNAKLNSTYVPYGEKGEYGLANQVVQDSNASRLGVQSCSSRIVAKGGAMYDNASWDLVDKTLEEGFDWDRVGVDSLPEPMQTMNLEQRTEFIESKRSEREKIQTQIQQASDLRETFVKNAIAEQIGESGLGAAMRKTIREQAIAKGFSVHER